MTHRSKPLAAGLAALALTLTLTPVQAKKTTYLDVDDNLWYSSYVAFCQQHQLMDGRTSSSFAPGELLTRAALTEALYRLEGSPAVEPEEELPFSDVAEDHPNLTAIRWAKNNGVVSGYLSGRFGPEDPITREQIAALLWSNQARQHAQSSAPFQDRADISQWAAEAVDWAFEAQLMTGTPSNSFLPQKNTNRAEGATILVSYAKSFYGLESGYPLPEPRSVPANPYRSDAFVLDENGYLSYTGGVCYRGLDVSSHQKEIDWTRVAGAGMEFAMIRAGYRGYTLGTINKDAYFDYNIQNALANGLDVGVYFYSQALTPAEAEEEAYQLLAWMEGYDVTYPVVFDWEEVDRDDSRSQNTDGNTVTACALAFCKVISDAGYTPMTYGSPTKIYKGGLALEYLQDYPFWLAHYTKDTAPTTFRYHYDIWQYSSTGTVDGIEGNVDLNLCMTDRFGRFNSSDGMPDDWWMWPA